MKSLLILGRGDTSYSDRNMVRLAARAGKAGFDVQRADYHEIEAIRDFRYEKINIALFFPFTFWNNNCETPKDGSLYGTSKQAYMLFRNYFLETRYQLETKFGRRRLHYLVPPENAPVDRDKVETIRRLTECGVPTSEQLHHHSLQEIIDAMTPEQGIFIKCRYGSEGKGITVLRPGRWITNYRVEGNKLTNYGVYEPWPFTEVTGRKELLNLLLRHEISVEREILIPDVFNAKKFDLRAYVVGDKVPHLFVRLNDSQKETTNFSQGAVIRHHPDTGLGKKCLNLARKIAMQAAKAMGLKFAGIDIMFDGSLDNVKVIEAQVFADFPDIRKFDLAKYLISDASSLFI